MRSAFTCDEGMPPVVGWAVQSPGSVVVSTYDDRWPARARQLLSAIRAALGDDVLHADHIGSTAVPGMSAKDVLDLQLSVDSLEGVSLGFAEPLAGLGLVEVPAYTFDHVPAGRMSPRALWEKRFFQRRGHPDGDVNLHVRRAGSPNERLALLFRDWLRAHPEAVPAYAGFKLALATAVPDLQGYTVMKDPVVDLVDTVAEAWAEQTGWRPHPAPQVRPPGAG